MSPHADSPYRNLVAGFNREIVVNSLTHLGMGGNIFDREWQLRLAQTVIGNICYHQFIRPRVMALNIGDDMKSMLDDLLMTLVTLLLSRILSGGQIDHDWSIDVIYVCLGVIIYHLMILLLRSRGFELSSGFQDALETSVVVSISMRMTQDRLLSMRWLPRALMQLGSIYIYHNVIGPVARLPKFDD